MSSSSMLWRWALSLITLSSLPDNVRHRQESLTVCLWAAAEQVTEQVALSDVARNSTDDSVLEVVMRKLTNQEVLAGL